MYTVKSPDVLSSVQRHFINQTIMFLKIISIIHRAKCQLNMYICQIKRSLIDVIVTFPRTIQMYKKTAETGIFL